jgi:hypothetical protein
VPTTGAAPFILDAGAGCFDAVFCGAMPPVAGGATMTATGEISSGYPANCTYRQPGKW